MATELLNTLINEFAANGIISSNELALLSEKAKEEGISPAKLDELIANALSNKPLNPEKSKSGFMSYENPKINKPDSKNIINDSKNNLSGFSSNKPNNDRPNTENNKESIQENLSGFIQARNNINKANKSDNLLSNQSGFLHSNNNTTNKESKDNSSKKSIFETGDDYFKNEKILSRQGNMSEIYVGIRHIRKVVIKRLKPKDRKNEKYIELLYKEFQNGLSLEHPNIVRVYDSGHDKNGPYYYMEYVDGRALSKLIRKTGVGNHKLVKKIAAEMLSALDYVHKKQVYHRDLKPENILVTYKGDNVKILDFGLALADDFADNMLKVGTPKYAAPEQMNNDFPVDGRSDLYSFGLILTEMLTGDIKNIEKVKSYSTKLAKLIQRCTETLPHNRYFSAGDVLNELDKVELVNGMFSDKNAVEKISETKVKQVIKETKKENPLLTKVKASKDKNRYSKPKREPVRPVKKNIPLKAKKQKTAKKKNNTLGIWLFFIIIVVTGYYIGKEMGFLNFETPAKNKTEKIEPKIMFIKAKRLRLRSTKSLQKKNVIGLYPQGTRVTVYELDDEWAKVKVDGKTGYMAFPGKFLTSVSQ